ncbi:hypothetical protein AGMMS4952_22770 [Spirochaetia bacterium]|nr:hypothetical protein AGMMS4952_22770 [Spirochaetia bacterium]
MFDALAPGGQVYFYAEVKRVKPILTHVVLKNINMKQTLSLLDKVDFLSGAFYPRVPSVPGVPRTMLLHAWRQKGKIPGGGFLAMSRQWKKTPSPSGANYWHSSRYGLSVSIQNKDALVSDGDPFIDGSPVEAPENLGELRRQALVVGWLENAGAPINNFIAVMGLPVRIPVEQILFALYEVPGPEPESDTMYEVLLRAEAQNANQAKSLVSILALVRRALQAEGLPEVPGMAPEFREIIRPFLVNPPGVDGSGLLIRTAPMTAPELALLLNRFTVYSP